MKKIFLKILFVTSLLLFISAVFTGSLSDILQDKKILIKDFKDDTKKFDKLRNIRIILAIISIILFFIYLLLGGNINYS